MMAPTMLKKMKMPRPDQAPIHNAKFTYRFPKSQKVNELIKALKRIMYMPVEETTAGWTPIPINTGLNTTPPPSPTAPARPPPIDAIISFTRLAPSYSMSDLQRPIFVAFLISLSC